MKENFSHTIEINLDNNNLIKKDKKEIKDLINENIENEKNKNAIERIKKEYEDLSSNPITSISCSISLVDEDNIFK